jgi:hypothetical protein
MAKPLTSLFCLMALSSPVHICAENYDFDKDILPILERVCIDCHGPEKQKGDLRLDQLNPNFPKEATSTAGTMHLIRSISERCLRKKQKKS